jgi:Xaa-Pro aminopeptidase
VRNHFSARLTALRVLLEERGLPALLVTSRENVAYLSGFSWSPTTPEREALLIVTADGQYLVTDFRYYTQAEQQAPDWTLIHMVPGVSQAQAVCDALLDLCLSEVGFDPDDVSVGLYTALQEGPDRLVPAGGLVERLRIVKDAGEIASIHAAAALTDAACAHLLSLARPGVTERELALAAEWHMREHGAEGPSFDIIVAAGPNSALPHAVPGDRPLQPGDLLLIDMGARYQGYCADLSRTVAIGAASPLLRELYQITWEAQQAALAGLHAGMTGAEADALARGVIHAAGYGANFGHGTGHAVGLAIHEEPRLRVKAATPLPAGCVVTVEPGIYLQDFGGVRIEDLVVVRDNGIENLTTAPKPRELPVLG